MEKETITTEASAATIVPQEVEVTSIPTAEDVDARYQALEKEKENYKNAYLKERNKHREPIVEDEDEDEKINRKVQEAIANSRLAEIAQEQDSLIKKALKENRELKLAVANKTTTPSATIGTHSETIAVKDTSVTPEQMAFFKSKGWDDKTIQRYKDNLKKQL